MARNLHKAGLLEGVWNRTLDKAATLAVELGCSAAAHPAELAGRCDVLVLCVSADADVLAAGRRDCHAAAKGACRITGACKGLKLAMHYLVCQVIARVNNTLLILNLVNPLL